MTQPRDTTDAELVALAALSAAEVAYCTMQLFYRVKNDLEVDHLCWYIGGPATTKLEEELKKRDIL